MANPQFGLLEARNVVERMDALERFLEFWFGPRRAKYGETERRLSRLPLPYPLRRFYCFAGKWPSAEPDRQEFFYTGGAGHHLQALDHVEIQGDGKLNFFMEYQGDWNGLTLPEGEDPPVWLSGFVEDGEDEQTVQVCDSLSRFLVTHCLMVILYEMENSVTVGQKEGALVDYFRELSEEPWRQFAAPVKVWDTQGLHWPESCLSYEGEFFLLADSVLVHRTPHRYLFGALKLPGVRTLVGRLESELAAARMTTG